MQQCIFNWSDCVSQAQVRGRQRIQRARHFIRHWHYRVFLRHADQYEPISWTNVLDLIRVGYLFFNSMSDETLGSWERMLLKQRDDHYAAARPVFIENSLDWIITAKLACVLAAYNVSIGRHLSNTMALWLSFGGVVEEDMQLDYFVQVLGGDPTSTIDGMMPTQQDDVLGTEHGHQLPALSHGDEGSEADLSPPADEWPSSPSTLSQKRRASSMNETIATPMVKTVKRSLVNRIKSLRL